MFGHLSSDLTPFGNWFVVTNPCSLHFKIIGTMMIEAYQSLKTNECLDRFTFEGSPHVRNRTK